MSAPAPPSQAHQWDEVARRANAKRLAGEMEGAARDFDAVLGAAPGHPAALHGRARLALARGEADALARFDAALKIRPGDADLWLGKAQALHVDGDVKGARVVVEQIASQAPGFIAALEFLAGLKLAAGDKDFAQEFRTAARRLPQDPNIPAAHVDALAGLDHAHAAADVAKEARARFPNEPHFALLEAANASAAGEWDRAEAIFAQLQDKRPARLLHEARHALRARDAARAGRLLEKVLGHNPHSIAGWALQTIVWRLAGDERTHWLHEQAGLVQMLALKARTGLIDEATDQLRTLHKHSSMPLSQSLRGGTQTRGILFHRTEPVLTELRDAIMATLEDYRGNLPETDTTHPLLRHRDSRWALAGSWSVRLTGSGSNASSGDYHTAHIHPEGVLSSALYCEVPDAIDDDCAQQGWLELGRPPKDLRLDLGPLATIKPRKGYLALFPSFLYHGTTEFCTVGLQERITTAFDVAAGPQV